MVSYPDYSKSESDKRAAYKQNSSGNQALVYGNESQSDVSNRRLSFDISGDSILSTGGNQRKSPNPLSYEASGKYCPVIKMDESIYNMFSVDEVIILYFIIIRVSSRGNLEYNRCFTSR